MTRGRLLPATRERIEGGAIQQIVNDPEVPTARVPQDFALGQPGHLCGFVTTTSQGQVQQMWLQGSMFGVPDVGDSVQRGFDEFAEWVPNFVGFLAILIVGFFVAKILGSLVRRLLERAGLDRTLHSGMAGSFISRVTSSPSRLLGRITFWLIFIGAISIAVDVLGIAALEDFVATVWSYVPNVIAALLIFLVAGAIAAGVAGLAGLHDPRPAPDRRADRHDYVRIASWCHRARDGPLPSASADENSLARCCEVRTRISACR